MKWCTIQTNEYDLQAKTYPNICTHHKLHNNNESNSRFSRNVYAISDRIWWNNHLRNTTTENMITMGMVDTSDLKMIITWAIDISMLSLTKSYPCYLASFCTKVCIQIYVAYILNTMWHTNGIFLNYTIHESGSHKILHDHSPCGSVWGILH